MRKNSARAALVSAAAMALTMIPLAGTSYAASCSGAGCDNKGPATYNCDANASTMRTLNSNSRVAELRWSHDCIAAWVRIKNNADPSVYTSYATIEKYDGAGKFIKSLSVTTPGYGGSDWSNMLGGSTYYYRVCVRFDDDLYPLQCSTKW
ncbi:DUF2690 domain-containing protein [Streptomyces sp. ME02-8801-2C]|uniref:DUF2690 domain-containing protein n=1 Tax=Streptomyces sp. ME02-8801-2C TaxID=3028680 RepID=UPI0029A3CDBB|nr:DUF2690 domain-containing protein [Streptomyces sp. ME02-8801-2C]MDX3458232.1 DUF2690 domain-containing protein [Streptomyces sp. ME02-8801-2C]